MYCWLSLKINEHARKRVMSLFCRSRLQWLSAIQIAISYSGTKEGYQRAQANRRKQLRYAESLKLHEENRRRRSQILDIQQTRAQLEAEKLVTNSYIYCGVCVCMYIYLK